MLGSLARWLRILGYNTLYYVDMDDDLLIKEAEKTDRILVTRDNELSKRAKKNGTKTILIQSPETLTQLTELVATLDLNITPQNTRCPRCNGELNDVEKESVRDTVPVESFYAYDLFWRCSSCDAVYWRGSHWAQIQKSLKCVASKSL